jgi:hypothetical protein
VVGTKQLTIASRIAWGKPCATASGKDERSVKEVLFVCPLSVNLVLVNSGTASTNMKTLRYFCLRLS